MIYVDIKISFDYNFNYIMLNHKRDLKYCICYFTETLDV